VKRLAGAVCIAAGMFVGAGIASAEYQQPGPALVLNPSRVVPGGTVTVSLQVTCVDGDSIGFQIEPAGDQSAAICDANTYAARLTAPSRPGTYDVNAQGEVRLAQATLTVTAALGGPEQPMPSTGPEHALSIAVIGGALFAGGFVLLALARFRHNASIDAVRSECGHGHHLRR
jgi:LPXTG-motif cell wall-anchored protein